MSTLEEILNLDPSSFKLEEVECSGTQLKF